jgi:hypothetical protein
MKPRRLREDEAGDSELPPNWEVLVQEFLGTKSAPRTRMAYYAEIARLVRALGARSVAAVSSADLLAWRDTLDQLGEDTRRRKLAAVKGFFAFCSLGGHITNDPARVLYGPSSYPEDPRGDQDHPEIDEPEPNTEPFDADEPPAAEPPDSPGPSNESAPQVRTIGCPPPDQVRPSADRAKTKFEGTPEYQALDARVRRLVAELTGQLDGEALAIWLDLEATMNHRAELIAAAHLEAGHEAGWWVAFAEQSVGAPASTPDVASAMSSLAEALLARFSLPPRTRE